MTYALFKQLEKLQNHELSEEKLLLLEELVDREYSNVILRGGNRQEWFEIMIVYTELLIRDTLRLCGEEVPYQDLLMFWREGPSEAEVQIQMVEATF